MSSPYPSWLQRVTPGSCWLPLQRPKPTSWYVLGADQQSRGPYTIAALQEYYSRGYLHETTRVWADGGSDWQPLSSVLGFSNSYTDYYAYRQPQPATYAPVQCWHAWQPPDQDLQYGLHSIRNDFNSLRADLNSIHNRLLELQERLLCSAESDGKTSEHVIHNDAVVVQPEAVSDTPIDDEGVIAPTADALQSECTKEELKLEAPKVEDKSTDRDVLVSGKVAAVLTIDHIKINPLQAFNIKYNALVNPASQFRWVVLDGSSRCSIRNDGSVLWFSKICKARGVFDPGGDIRFVILTLRTR